MSDGSDYRHTERSRQFEPSVDYAYFREQCPMHKVVDHDPPFYVLSRFDDIVDTLKHPNDWLNRDGPGVFYQEEGVLGTTDDPDHARHRQVLRSAFVPSAIARLEPSVRAIAGELFDAFVPAGRGEFIEAIAAPLPGLAIAELLGIKAESRHEFGRWSSLAVDALTGGDVALYNEAKATIGGHIDVGLAERDALVAAGQPCPDDVLTLLAAARREGTMTAHEARYVGYQLLVAGHETTTSLIGRLLYRLIERPELMAQLRAHPELIPAAVEEGVRFDAPAHGLFRTNAEATEVHGVAIPARSKIQLLFAAANRDPRRFEQPDEFRIDRDRHEIGRHVGFGWGVHHCIGAPLARLETRIAFEELLARMADIELDGQPQRNQSFVLHGLTRLPLRWTPNLSEPSEGT